MKRKPLLWLVGSGWLVALAVPLQLAGSDCNRNGSDDIADIAAGVSRDCNANLVPDECELAEGAVAYEARLSLHTGFAAGVAAEDFDGDGDLDLVAMEFYAPGERGGSDPERAVVFARNLGGGKFADPVRYPAGGKPYGPHVDDFDRDGDLDLLVRFGDTGAVGFYRNRGDGTFGGPENYSVTGEQEMLGRLRTADFDGDGFTDFIVAFGAPVRGLAVFHNQGDGTFRRSQTVAVERAYYIDAGDLDGDGDIDVALDTSSNRDHLPAYFVVLLNDGTGAFSVREEHALGAYPQEVALSDLDGDGDLDFAVAGGWSPENNETSNVNIFHNRGDGTFERADPLATGFLSNLLAVADLDLDGDPDIVTASDGLYGTRESIALFLNDGTGTFGPPAMFTVGDEPTEIAVYDANGDGLPDIHVLNYFGESLSVLENLGNGTFAEAVEFPIPSGAAPRMTYGDVDGDGDIDVVAAGFSDDDSITILENVTGGTFLEGCVSFLRGDVNSDGRVSISDIVMLRRYLFDGAAKPTCLDAADATDNDEVNLCDAIAVLDVLFRNPGWSQTLPEPAFTPGEDPTPFGSEPPYRCDDPQGQAPTRPLGCLAYDVTPPETTDDLLALGDATAQPGETIKIPVYLSASVEVDAVQLVVDYDPEILEIDPENAFDFEGTYFESFDPPPHRFASVDPEEGLLVAALAGDLILSGREILPGEEILIAWLAARVKETAPAGLVPIELTNGENGEGVGPYGLRNELTHRGEARFASLLPRVQGGMLAIAGEESAFVRGDANGDGAVDMSDAVRTLGALFRGESPLPCEDAGDANDDGRLDISDPIYTLNALFAGGPAIPEPFPSAGLDPTPDFLFCAARGAGE